MKYRYLLLAGALAQAGVANGMGLGKLDLHSYLGAPLQADIELLSPGQFDENQIRVRIARSSIYHRMGAQFEAFHNNIEFDLERSTSGRLMVHLHSNQRVTEPFLDIVVQLSWPNGTSYRRYSVLMDPPSYAARWNHAVTPEQAVAPERTVASAPDVLRLARAAHLAHWYGSSKATPKLPVGDRTYRVRHGDSLWKIARQVRGDSAMSVHAIMAQLYTDNPDAFIAGNRNRLKLGAQLRLPVVAELHQQVAQETAKKSVPVEVKVTPVRAETNAVNIQAELSQARQAQTATLPDTVAGIKAAIAGLERDKQHLQAFQLQVKSELSQLQQQQGVVTSAMQSAGQLQNQLQQDVHEDAPVTQPAAVSPVEEKVAVVEPAPEASSVTQTADTGQHADVANTPAVDTKVAEAPVAEDNTVAPQLDIAADMMTQDLTRPAPQLANKLVIGSGPGLWYLLALLPLGLLMTLFGMRSHRVQRIRASEVVKDGDLHDLVFGSRRDRTRSESPEQLRQALSQIREKAGSFDRNRAQDGYPGTDASEGRDDLKQMIELYLLYSQYQKALNVILTEISKRPARPDLRLYLMQVYATMGDWDSFDEQLSILQAMGNEKLLNEALKMRESLPH